MPPVPTVPGAAGAQPGRGRAVAFACARHPAPPLDAERLPCLRGLTPGRVLSAFADGREAVELHRPSCAACSLAGAQNEGRTVVETSRALLGLAGRSTTTVREIVTDVPPTVETVSSRRGFFARIVGRTAARAEAPRDARPTLLGALDRLAASSGAAPAGAVAARDGLGWVSSAPGDARCTACGACVQACASDALALERRGDASALSFVPRACIACGTCVNACASGALTLTAPPSLRAGLDPTRVLVLEATGRPCATCGALVRHASLTADEVRCAACAMSSRRGFALGRVALVAAAGLLLAGPARADEGDVVPLDAAPAQPLVESPPLQSPPLLETPHRHHGPDPRAALADGKTEPTAGEPWRFGGSIDLRGTFRFTDDGRDPDSDQDLSQYIALDGGYGDHVAFEASGRVDEDIDGRQTPGLFTTITDTYRRSARALLFTAHVDLLDLGPLALLRAGRQYGDPLGPDLHFDGGRLDLRPFDGDVLTVSVYGGQPVNLYETSRRGDWLGGAALVVRPARSTTIRGDYVHITDRRREYRTTLDDDLFQLTLSQGLTDSLRVVLRAATFEGRSTRASAQVLLASPAWDLRASLRYTVQAGDFRDLSIQFSPLDQVLGGYAPFHELALTIDKGIGEHFGLAAGGNVRELMDEDDEGPFNHEFARAYGEARTRDLPWSGLDLVATVEQYWAMGDDRTLAATGEVAQRFGDSIQVAAGTSYALYRFDEVLVIEREDVRTYYLRAEWKLGPHLMLRASYAAERDDDEFTNTIRAGARLSW